MQLDRKTLAFLQMPSSKGDLYAPASGSKGLVHHIVLHNSNTVAEAVVLNYHNGTNEYEIFSQSIAAGATLIWDFKGAGDIVEDGGKYTGNTTTSSKVTIKVMGTEETPGGGQSLIEGATSNLWVPPSVAHAYDDEFESSTLSGWTGVQNTTDGVAGSFSYGSVDAYDTAFNSGNVVRVNSNEPVRPSWAQIQVPAYNKTFYIYKSVTLPTNMLVVARMKFNIRLGTPTNDALVGLCLRKATGGVPTGTGQLGILLNESDVTTQAQTFLTYASGAGGSSVSSTDTASQGQALEYAAIHKIDTTYHIWVGTASGNWIWMTSYGSLDFVPDLVSLGFENGSVLSPGVKVCCVDFVRFYETDNFLL